MKVRNIFSSSRVVSRIVGKIFRQRKMNSRVLLTSLTLFVLYVASTQAASIGNSKVSLRCQCINTRSKFIHPRRMENVKIIPSGPHCSKVEIIAILKNDSLVCLNPEAVWVKKFIAMITNW